jgi:predicted ATPase/predicted negative regulator of RcsB-dependent stress response
VGVGGIGKTRLALTVAERFVRPSHSTSMHNLLFSDGVFFVPLAPIEDGEALIKTIADHLKMTFAGADPARTQLLNYLAEKRILLVLDNFEHLTTHTELLSDILKSAPNVKLLVTSRELLRLRGEQLYEVPPLGMASISNSLEDMAGACASQLFIQSAKRVSPDFEFDETTAPHVVRITSLVGGLPLGIELSASWLEMLTIEEIGDEIEKSLDFLETDLRDVPERQRSLRAVFEYSWNLLTDDEREVFTKLAIFRGGFEREAGQKIAGASLRALTSLVNKSLIQRFPNGRYGLNKVLNQYAEEILKQRADIDSVRENHAMYFSDLLKKSTPLFNTRKEKTAIEMIDTEWENIRTAMQHAMEAGEWEAIGKVSYPMLMYYVNRSLFKEGRDSFNKVAEMLKLHYGEDDLYWRIRVYQAWLMSRLADYADSWAYVAPAHAYFKANNVLTDMGETLNLMSYVRMMQGDYGAAVGYAEEAMTYAEHAPQEHLTWYMSNGNLGYAELLRGNQQKALEIYEEIVRRMVEASDYSPNGIGYMLNNKGEILRSLGRFNEAHALFQEAFDIFEANNIKRGMAFTLNNIGGIQVANEDIMGAQKYYERAYLLNKEIGDQNGIAHSLSALGNNQMYLGNAKEAKAYYEKSLAIRKKIGELRGIADSLLDLGGVYTLMDDFESANKHFYEAQAIYRQIQEPDGIGSSLISIISLQFVLNQLDDAEKAIEELAELANKSQTLFVKAILTMLKIALAIAANRLDEAETELREINLQALNMTYTFRIILAVQWASVFAKRGDLGRAYEIITVIRDRSETTIGFLRMFAPFILKQIATIEESVQKNLPSETRSLIEKQTQNVDMLFESLFGTSASVS